MLESTILNAIHSKLGDGRRVAIPADICHRYGLRPGDPVVLEASDAGIMVRPLDAVIREVQASFAGISPRSGEYLSDELTRERRDEADREDRG